MRELTVTEKDCAQQLIKYLSKYMEEAPKSFFYKMLRKKNIVLNQKKADGSEKLKTGDTIRMYLAEETIEKFRKTPEKPAGKQVKYPKLDIVYEDEKVIFPEQAGRCPLTEGERDGCEPYRSARRLSFGKKCRGGDHVPRRTLQSSGPEYQRSDSCRKNRCGDAAAFRTDRRAGCWKILSDGCKRNRDRDRADPRIPHKKMRGQTVFRFRESSREMLFT